MTGFWHAIMLYADSERAVFDFANFLMCYGLAVILLALESRRPS